MLGWGSPEPALPCTDGISLNSTEKSWEITKLCFFKFLFLFFLRLHFFSKGRKTCPRANLLGQPSLGEQESSGNFEIKLSFSVRKTSPRLAKDKYSECLLFTLSVPASRGFSFYSSSSPCTTP